MSEKHTTDLNGAIVSSIQDKKGKDITLIDLTEIQTAPAPAFILCRASNPTQASAIADWVEEHVRDLAARKPLGQVGRQAGNWVILDYGEVMVHIFLREFLEIYDLEGLWSDGKITHIPDLD